MTGKRQQEVVGRSASVKDVAAAAGVSLGTVSNVLNRPYLVREATRRRVEQAMSDLGFIRNESARQLRAGRSRTLGYVMLDATNPFFTDVAAGMEIAAERADLTLYLCNSDSRKNREVMYLDALQQQRVQGILITPVEPDSPQLEAVVGRGTPLVVVDRHSRDTDFCTVAVDDRLGGRLAIEHLVDQGHTSVAFVAGPMSIGQVRDRYEGAKDAWRDAGLPDSALICITGSALTASEGRSAGERLSGLPRKRRPTAAFCANDLLALGLLQNFITAGRRVPEDIAIVGYDDIDFAASAAVPLTSIRQPRQELGTKAAELVIDEADNPEHTHEHVVFIPEIVARASTLGLRSSLRA